MKIRGILFVITVAFLLVLVGCKEKETKGDADVDNTDNLTDSGLPIVKEPITLKMFAGQSNQSSDKWNDLMIWNEYEDRTNINVDWEQVPNTSLEEKRNLILASNEDLPDVFYSAGIPVQDVYKYGKQGTFIELNDLIDEYAPNLKKLMDEDPSIQDAITFPDGNIYTLPYLTSPEFVAMRTNPFMWINKEWVEELDMDIPKTTEQFYQYLKAVKETDLKGDGEGKEIPYGDDGIDRLVAKLYGSFGLNNTGGHNALIDLDPDGDELRFIPTSDGYKELLEYVHKLYSEELIQQNIYSTDNDQYIANNEENLYGSTTYWPTPMLFGENESVSLEPLEGPNGDKLYSTVSHPVGSLGNFAITKGNENPEATMRWVDYFYSDEGSKFFYMGLEGETYEETEDGEVEYLEEILTESTIGISVAKYLAWVGVSAPALVKQEYFSGSESSPESLEAAEKVEPYVVDEIWPNFTYTDDENKELIPIRTDLAKYIEEKQAEFITGERSFSEWDDFVETLEKIGKEDFMRINGQAYERMMENQSK